MELDIQWDEQTIWDEKTVKEKDRPQIEALLRKGIQNALTMKEGLENSEIGLLLVDDKAIQRYNNEYRGRDYATDVLSFAMQEKGEGEPDLFTEGIMEVEEDAMLGDLIISVERAREQAEEYGHPFEREIVYLAVHGTLHLLGFDHFNDKQTAKMREAEEKVMAKLGLPR